MIQFLYRDQLASKPVLAHSMFFDRGVQFKTRLGWNVNVNASGEERDQYDLLNPLYVIVTDDNGRHEASMRVLPTTGETMLNDYFMDIVDGVSIKSPAIWECTRFCISSGARPHSAAKLMAAGGKVMQCFRIEHFVGVFDRQMLPVYRLLGAVPTVVGWSQGDTNRVGVGLWEYSHDGYENMLDRCGLSTVEMELFVANSGLFDTETEDKLTVAA
ncbi:acyl-homoserine-lactone synthase [Tateyamaria sp. SN6-1]|uniref:acyl-homoserine-lactone synthase n=1 Tax=Tateyamaria sp. SN6-1 TaxID=3092148 RepID=UPI0039F4B24E